MSVVKIYLEIVVWRKSYHLNESYFFVYLFSFFSSSFFCSVLSFSDVTIIFSFFC